MAKSKPNTTSKPSKKLSAKRAAIGRKKDQAKADKLRRQARYKTQLYKDQEDRITSAIEAYKSEEDPDITSLYIAALVFKVPYSTTYVR